MTDVPLTARLCSLAPDVCRAAIAEVAARDAVTPAELGALASCLGHARKAVQRPAAEAFAALAVRGVPVREVLLGALADPAPRLRWGAAFALAQLGPPPAAVLPVLVETLGSDDGDLRWAAARILPHVGDRGATIALLRDLSAGGDPRQRKMAFYSLRDLDARGPEIDAAVGAGLVDADRDVRLAAVTTLARVAVDRAAAAERLSAVLAGDDLPVRRSAAAALGVLAVASDAVLAALGAAAATDDPGLAHAAERALAALRTDQRG